MSQLVRNTSSRLQKGAVPLLGVGRRRGQLVGIEGSKARFPISFNHTSQSLIADESPVGLAETQILVSRAGRA